MTRDEAIAKARKLLSLAESDNAHEAALATARAQEIFDRYEINQAIVDLQGEENEPDKGRGRCHRFRNLDRGFVDLGC